MGHLFLLCFGQFSFFTQLWCGDMLPWQFFSVSLAVSLLVEVRGRVAMEKTRVF